MATAAAAAACRERAGGLHDAARWRQCCTSALCADVERDEALEKLAAVEERDKHLLKRCEDVAACMMRMVLCRALGTHAVRLAGNLMAHCPLLDERLSSMTTQFVLYDSPATPVLPFVLSWGWFPACARCTTVAH